MMLLELFVEDLLTLYRSPGDDVPRLDDLFVEPGSLMIHLDRDAVCRGRGSTRSRFVWVPMKSLRTVSLFVGPSRGQRHLPVTGSPKPSPEMMLLCWGPWSRRRAWRAAACSDPHADASAAIARFAVFRPMKSALIWSRVMVPKHADAERVDAGPGHAVADYVAAPLLSGPDYVVGPSRYHPQPASASAADLVLSELMKLPSNVVLVGA